MRHPDSPRRMLTLLAAAVLSACASMAPPHERPALPVPATFGPAGAAAPVGAATAVTLPWQDFFTDPALRGLIAAALQNNRDLRVAVLNVEAVRAQHALRRADTQPSLNAGLTAARQTGSSGAVVGTYTAGFSAAYELDLFGRLNNVSEAAAAQVLASEEARRAAQITLVASVAQQALTLAADRELLALAQRTLAAREQTLSLTQLKLTHGAASELDLRQAQTLVAAARIAQAQSSRQVELDRNALTLLVGQALPGGAPVDGGIERLVLPEVAAGLSSDVLLGRPDVRQAEQQLAAANASIGAARAAFWPRITLTASAGTASASLSNLFKDGAWSFAGQVLQPLFDGGRNRANLAAAEAQRDIAVAQYERAVQAAFRDVADALAGRATLGEQLAASLAQAQAEQARLALVELRFKNGAASSLELLDAQRSQFAAQQALVQAQLALLVNRVAVYRALGGGHSQPAKAA